MTRRTALRLGLAMIAAVAAAGCGKKGPPEPPNPDTNKFPRQYPKLQ